MIESRVRIRRLSRFMVFAADDENIVPVRMRLQPDVVIRVQGVPIQCRGNAAFGD